MPEFTLQDVIRTITEEAPSASTVAGTARAEEELALALRLLVQAAVAAGESPATLEIAFWIENSGWYSLALLLQKIPEDLLEAPSREALVQAIENRIGEVRLRHESGTLTLRLTTESAGVRSRELPPDCVAVVFWCEDQILISTAASVRQSLGDPGVSARWRSVGDRPGLLAPMLALVAGAIASDID